MLTEHIVVLQVCVSTHTHKHTAVLLQLLLEIWVIQNNKASEISASKSKTSTFDSISRWEIFRHIIKIHDCFQSQFLQLISKCTFPKQDFHNSFLCWLRHSATSRKVAGLSLQPSERLENCVNDTVAKLDGAPCYKPEGHGFYSRCYWIFFFFKLPNLASRTMALGLTQLLTEMSTRNLN
jgi:hypothetical protein